MAFQRLPLAQLESAVIAPVISPLPTAVALIAHVLRGSLPELRGTVLAQLRPRDVEALLPLLAVERGDGGGGRPNEIVPPGSSMTDQLEAVIAVDPDVFTAGVEAAERAGHPVGPWRAAAADPGRWLRAYAVAVRRAWTALEPMWVQAAGRLDREVERVSVALARGAGGALIAERFPQSAVEAEAVLLPSHSGAPGDVRAGPALVLQPLLAPDTAAGWTDDYGSVCLAVRYPVPAPGVDVPPPASLEALLGPPRARILAHLDRPASAGELARLLRGVPSMASHHVRALERAGLVNRVREGRAVIVRRTARGTELVALYTASP
ncbi:winged helix-turn-helix transcriptional regulator [Solirubrobacter sp. CPCC 204708]|uniref:Winged helix-turn-helix domain-containing protein n=1 Tax=Solirubrobacter deserti TaxID=2282478 RepID=A0ABT4RJZ4_9ACTN|nr:winged helix-turn-helix domain-containing protein [Solirubrobacter deserti]MBE2315786.1 winged helix-turn-helix transcriptional regulator [Solirubrobacter deserti]MDA0138877.1 winged helix-turn-helix domain-containing protein [Solirubrobacter deserti]